jgi:hypothetical protein
MVDILRAYQTTMRIAQDMDELRKRAIGSLSRIS